MSKYRPSNHIIGKVYDLTQDNMNAMIKHIEDLQNYNHKYMSKNVDLRARIEKMRVIVGIDHDTMYPPGKCDLCDLLRSDYEADETVFTINTIPEPNAVKQLRERFYERKKRTKSKNR
jgi:hypothetical protein